MKNISWIINGVLVIAVGVLYYFHFAKSSSGSSSGGSESSEPVAKNIVYVQTDSVIGNYEFSKEKQKFLEEKNNQRAADLQGRQSSYENSVRKYQNDLPILTNRERQLKEESLMKLQNDLMQLQQQYEQEAMAEGQVLISAIADTLDNFFKGYVKGKNIDFVLGYQPNGTVFYKNPALDITGDVITQLNERYKKSNPSSSK